MSERSHPTIIEDISLGQSPIAPPPLAFRIAESNFAVASADADIPHLVTAGLIYCKALTFFDPQNRKGLLAHIFTADKLWDVINILIAEMERMSLEGVVCHLISGSRGDELREDSTVFASINLVPTIDEIKEAVLQHKPDRLIIDRYKAPKSRGLWLDLETGSVLEILRTETYDRTIASYRSAGVPVPLLGAAALNQLK